MLLEVGYVVIECEHALHGDFDLVGGQVREGGAQQGGSEVLNVGDVVGRRPQLALDPARLYQREYVREDRGVHRQTCEKQAHSHS